MLHVQAHPLRNHTYTHIFTRPRPFTYSNNTSTQQATLFHSLKYGHFVLTHTHKYTNTHSTLITLNMGNNSRTTKHSPENLTAINTIWLFLKKIPGFWRHWYLAICANYRIPSFTRLAWVSRRRSHSQLFDQFPEAWLLRTTRLLYIVFITLRFILSMNSLCLFIAFGNVFYSVF